MSYEAYMIQSADVIRSAGEPRLQAALEAAIETCVGAIKANKPILVCGNGGSASDAMHISAELVARFLINRRALNCICLSANTAMITAWSNDIGYETVFSRQVEAHGCEGAILLAISTSGNSPNIVKACEQAKAMGMKVISMTGQGGGKMAVLSDILLDAPTKFTPMVQQVHLCQYHYLCEKIEALCAEG